MKMALVCSYFSHVDMFTFVERAPRIRFFFFCLPCQGCAAVAEGCMNPRSDPPLQVYLYQHGKTWLETEFTPPLYYSQGKIAKIYVPIPRRLLLDVSQETRSIATGTRGSLWWRPRTAWCRTTSSRTTGGGSESSWGLRATS